jgi:hypothetical protein
LVTITMAKLDRLTTCNMGNLVYWSIGFMTAWNTDRLFVW